MTPTQAQVQRQVELEQRWVHRAAERYREQQQARIEAGRGSETASAQKLFKLMIEEATELLEEMIEKKASARGRPSAAMSLVKKVQPEFAIKVGMSELFNSAALGKHMVQDAYVKIGTRIEDQVKFSRFKDLHPDYYDTLMQSFKRNGTENYRHRHRVLTRKLREFNVCWNDWTNVERAKVGNLVAECILFSTAIFELYKTGPRSGKFVRLTDDAMNWIEQFDDVAQWLQPQGGPMLVPPLEWDGMWGGGFYTPEMQSRFPFVRTRYKNRVERRSDFTKHQAAANKLQKTAWNINAPVLDVLIWIIERNLGELVDLPSTLPIPVPPSPVEGVAKEDFTQEQEEAFSDWKREASISYTMERKRHAKALSLHGIRSTASWYRDKDFWFTWTADSRGRLYPVATSLSPQGADYSKGLLKFKEGKRVGKRGGFWLLVAGANLYGYDKETYRDRALYTMQELKDGAVRVAENPYDIDALKFIADADKPLQFLAWCFEFRQWLEEGEDFVSHLWFGMDGSCNGLQNFSALLRDPVGAYATNVGPSDKPNDIYAQVLDVAVRKLTAAAKLGDVHAARALQLELSRKTTKRSVMTLPYGLTKLSSRDYVSEWMREKHPELLTDFIEFRLIRDALNEAIWESIGEVVVAAVQAMKWLKQAASRLTRNKRAIEYTGPTGFYVVSEEHQSKSIKIDSVVEGAKAFRIRRFTDKLDGVKQANGIAPNYVHHLDVAHLVFTMLREEVQHIDSWMMVHDDYGTHFADADALYTAIREAFVELYDGVDHLQRFIDEITEGSRIKFPDKPELGSFDITEVRESKYFFG